MTSETMLGPGDLSLLLPVDECFNSLDYRVGSQATLYTLPSRTQQEPGS